MPTEMGTEEGMETEVDIKTETDIRTGVDIRTEVDMKIGGDTRIEHIQEAGHCPETETTTDRMTGPAATEMAQEAATTGIAPEAITIEIAQGIDPTGTLQETETAANMVRMVQMDPGEDQNLVGDKSGSETKPQTIPVDVGSAKTHLMDGSSATSYSRSLALETFKRIFKMGPGQQHQ